MAGFCLFVSSGTRLPGMQKEPEKDTPKKQMQKEIWKQTPSGLLLMMDDFPSFETHA